MDTWAESDGYDEYMGRWSRPVGRTFLTWWDVPVESEWVDVGCGTGASTATIAEESTPARISQCLSGVRSAGDVER